LAPFAFRQFPPIHSRVFYRIENSFDILFALTTQVVSLQNGLAS